MRLLEEGRNLAATAVADAARDLVLLFGIEGGPVVRIPVVSSSPASDGAVNLEFAPTVARWEGAEDVLEVAGYRLEGRHGQALCEGTVSDMDGDGDMKLQTTRIERGALVTIAAFTHSQE